MLIKAIIGFLALPGTVAFLVPLLITKYDPWKRPFMPMGALGIILGAFILIWCARDFYLSGEGTLTPWEPPKNLVVIGLYRFVRNPMYLGVLTLVLGWSLLFVSPMLVLYLLLLIVSFHLRVIRYEEPRLREQYGDAWEAYRQLVPRWFPKI